MNSTKPVFILGTGRSGTFQMVKLLESIAGIEAHHEYLFENILKSAVLYRMGLKDKNSVKHLLTTTHVPAVHYSSARIWLDSSNALPWVIEPLYELFPGARFIHLLRDGRKVVSSFYNKFPDVMYDDLSVSIINAWLENPSGTIEPSPEKKFWRPLPIKGLKFSEEFQTFNRFQRLCYYWQDCNLFIKEAMAAIPSGQRLTVRLEDLVSQPNVLKSFLAVFDIQYDDIYMNKLKRPVNVHIPKNFPLSSAQNNQFNSIAGSAMKTFGYYFTEEYHVTY
jgi:hypothetical protein